MSGEPQTGDFIKAIDRLAAVVEVKSDVQEVHREVSVLTQVVKGQLSKQDVINRRLEEQGRELAHQGQAMLERLVAVEQVTQRFPQLENQVINLRTQMAKYIGGGLTAVLIINALIGWGIKFWGQ